MLLCVFLLCQVKSKQSQSTINCCTSLSRANDRKIEMVDKNKRGKCLRNKRRLTPCVQPDAAPQQLKSVYHDATKRPLKIIWNLCQYLLNRTRQQFTLWDLSCSAASSVDSITDYNEFYSILLRRHRIIFSLVVVELHHHNFKLNFVA